MSRSRLRAGRRALNVCLWHFGDIDAARFNVRFRAISDIRAWTVYVAE